MNYIWALLQALICIGILTFGTYIAVKKMKNKQFVKTSQHGLMQIIDGMSIGMNQQMYLVKVGDEEYFIATFGNQGHDMLPLQTKKFRDPKETFEKQYFEPEKPSYLLKDTAKKIKERLMQGEES